MQKKIRNQIEKIQSYLENKDLDYYDIRGEESSTTSIIIENKKIKNIKENKNTGVGIRVYKNQKLGFCSTNNLNNYKEIIDDCIKNTKKTNKKTKLNNFAKNKEECKIKYTDFNKKSLSEKSKELLKINTNFIKNIKGKDYRLLQSNLNYIEHLRKKYFINPNSNIYQEDPHTIMYSSLVGKRNNIVENSLERIGYLGGLETINQRNKEKLMQNNLKQLEYLLHSKPCPAKKSNILITPEISDLLAHEAIGHAAEADAIINDASILKEGQVLSNNKETNIIDNPTIKEFGYFKYDDEGIKAKPSEIVKKGVVENYLLDLESANILNKKPNGSARAESYSKMPIVRMSNTYFKEGKDKYENILSNFTGFLLDGFAGGQVDPSVGTFMFGIKFAKEYKNGQLINNYKQASISGNILNYLKKIDRISNKIGDFSFGFCGKGGQKAFVSGSGPHIKIKDVIVGGTKHE